TATGKVKRNMPDPVPGVLIGRLAVDRSCQGRGLGADLLRDAVLRIVGAAEIVGVRAILVHAMSDDAKRFYERFGFRASPVEPMTLMMTVEEVKRMVGECSSTPPPRGRHVSYPRPLPPGWGGGARQNPATVKLNAKTAMPRL